MCSLPPVVGSLSKGEDHSYPQPPESIQIWVRGGDTSQIHLSCSRHSACISVVFLWLVALLGSNLSPSHSFSPIFPLSLRSLGFTKLWNLILDTLTKETRRPETCEAHG